MPGDASGRPRRVWPALGVLFGAPVSAELLQSYLDVTGDLGETLFLVVFLAPLSGGAALLIREVAVRTGRGWPGIALLAAAFGVAMPGLVDLSLFTEHRTDVTDWEQLWAPTEAFGLSWHPAFTWSASHVVMSIGVPLALLDGLAPATRGHSLLHSKGIVAAAVLCLAIAGLIRADSAPGSGPTLNQTLGVLVVAGTLVGLALCALGRPRLPTREGRAWHPLAGALLGFALMASLDVPAPTWSGLVTAVSLVGATSLTLWYASSSLAWGLTQTTAVACGALLERALVGYLSPLPPGVAVAPKLVQTTVLLTGVVLLSRIALRRSAAG